MQHTNTSSTSGGSTTSLFVSRSGRAMAPHDKEQRQSNKNRLTLSKTPIFGWWRPAWILSYEGWDGNVAAFGPRARLDVHAVSHRRGQGSSAPLPAVRPALACRFCRSGHRGPSGSIPRCACARRAGPAFWPGSPPRGGRPRPAPTATDPPCGHARHVRHRWRCCSLFSPRFRAGRRACSPALLQLTCARLAR